MTFWSIGMADPFPDETTMMDSENQILGNEEFTADNLIYPEYKYRKDECPACIYVPSRPLLLKILRACMGCSSSKDLWFNKKSND